MTRYLLPVLAAQVAFSAAPVITELQPRGVEKGRTFTLTVVGRDLGEGASVSSSMPATFTAVLPPQNSPMAMMAAGKVASFLVEPKESLQPGVYPVRLQTASGISNILLFTVGTFPEYAESESAPYSQPNRNDSIEAAEPLPTTPITMNGTLRGAERDVFRLHAKAGDRRVIEAEARRSGSAIDPVLRLLDGAGKQLARSEDAPGAGLDARIDFTFPREGFYYIEVTDARFSRQAQNFYRLKVGSYPYAEGIFPLGGKRGETVTVNAFGGNLTAPVPVPVDLRSIDAERRLASAAVPNSAALPFLFAVGDLPEVIEPSGPVQPGVVINGRLTQAGEVDKFKIAVKPGEKLLLEVQARELGTSRLEAVIAAYDKSGKKIDSAGDKPLPEDVFAVQGTSRTSNDPFLNVAVPADTDELTVSIEDLAERGGLHYAYRLIVRRQSEDFSLSLATPYVNIPAGGSAALVVAADRRGYDGPIQLSVADLPAGVRVEGGMIPRETVDANNARSFNRRGMLILSSDSGVEIPAREFTVIGEGKLNDGSVLRRKAAGPGMAVEVAGATAQGVVDRQRSLTAPWLGMALPVSSTGPSPATLEVKQVKVTRMEEGDRYDFEYAWKLREKSAGAPETLGVDIVGARDIRVIDNERGELDAAAGLIPGKFTVTTTKATDPAQYDLIVRGRLKTAMGEEEVYARPLPFIVPERSNKPDVPTGQ